MPQPVTVYRWDDVGAPQVVDGKPSEYMEVIKKCLVDGYGTKQSLGWLTVLDEHLTSAPYLALQNDTNKGASGGTIMLSAINDNAGTKTTIQSAQSWIDKNNQMNKSAYFVFDRYSTTTNMLKNWMLMGTETAFYFFVTSDSKLSQNYFGTFESVCFFVGDYQSLYANDQARFIVVNESSLDRDNQSWSTNLCYKLTSSANNITNIYALDGSNNKAAHNIVSVVGNSQSASDVRFNSAAPEITILLECYLTAGGNNTFSSNKYYINNPVFPYVRGKMPGLYFGVELGYRDVAMPHILAINGVNYWQIPSATSNATAIWINLEQW